MKLHTPKERELDKKIHDLEQLREELRSKKMVLCTKCKKKTRLDKATVIDEYYYVPPRGCTGGDYHNFSEYQFYCAKCDSFNRAYTASFDQIRYSEPELKPEALKEPRVQLYYFIKEHHKYFGEKLSDYDKGGTIVEIRNKDTDRKERLKEQRER